MGRQLELVHIAAEDVVVPSAAVVECTVAVVVVVVADLVHTVHQTTVAFESQSVT